MENFKAKDGFPSSEVESRKAKGWKLESGKLTGKVVLSRIFAFQDWKAESISVEGELVVEHFRQMLKFKFPSSEQKAESRSVEEKGWKKASLNVEVLFFNFLGQKCGRGGAEWERLVLKWAI